jgi:hypothetical protein
MAGLTIGKFAAEHADKLDVVKLNVDENPQTAAVRDHARPDAEPVPRR